MPIGSGIHITAESFMERRPNPTKYFTSLLPVKLCIVYQYYSERIIVISHSGKPTQEMFSGLDTEDTCGSFASGTADEMWCCIVIRLYPVLTAYGIVHCWYQGHWLKQCWTRKSFFYLPVIFLTGPTPTTPVYSVLADTYIAWCYFPKSYSSLK